MKITQQELKYFYSLQKKKFRDIERKFLLEGWRSLQDALNSSFTIEMIAVLSETTQNPEQRVLIDRAKERRIPIKELKELQLKRISNTVQSQGVIAIVHQRTNEYNAKSLQSAKFIVACDHVSDPGNLGTILRTCDWFGVDAVLLSEGCVSLYNDKVIRSTAASIFHLNVFENLDFHTELSNLKKEGFELVATTLDGKPLQIFIVPKRVVLIVGNEAQGINDDVLRQADVFLSIPRYGQADSLNVGIASGIFLAHWRNQEARE